MREVSEFIINPEDRDLGYKNRDYGFDIIYTELMCSIARSINTRIHRPGDYFFVRAAN